MRRSARLGLEARVRVPATSANLGPGFDCLGLALDLYNEVRMAESDRPIVRLNGLGTGRLAADPSNLVYRSARRLFEAADRPMPPLALDMVNRIPPARGLGSSSAAIVAGLVGANVLAGRPFDADGLLALATEIEGHPDNVAPALLGGLVVTVAGPVAARGDGYPHAGPVRSIRLDPPPELKVALFIPETELSTQRARAALPESVPRLDAVFNTGRAALLVAAVATGRFEALAAATEDRLHQPYRAPLLPHLEPLMHLAREAGALGAFLSGAGPTVGAFVLDPAPVLAAWEQAAPALGIGGHGLTLAISRHGAHLI